MSDGPDGRPGGDYPDDSQWRPVDPPSEYAPPRYSQPPYPSSSYPQYAHPPSEYPPSDQPTGYPPTAQMPPGYPPTQPPDDPEVSRGSSRTVWLALAVAVLLVVLVGVLGYAVATKDDGEQTAAPTITSEAPLPIPSLPELPGEPSETDVPSSATPAPGQVLYSLSGTGQVLGFTWTVGNSFRVMPRLLRPPFSVAADVTGAPSLTAIILSGQVTCTITRDGATLATSTSSAGILRCTAPAG